MATTDRRGVSVDATDTPIAGSPNPGLAIKAPARLATSGSNIVLSGLLVVDGIQTVGGDRVLVKDETDPTTNGLYNASSGNWTRAIDANSNDQLTRGMQVLVSEGATNANTIFQLTSANPVTLGTSAITFVRTSVPSTISTTAPLAGGGSISGNPTFSLVINASLQVAAGALAVAALAGVAHKWVSSINSSGVPQLTQPAFSDISGTLSAAQIGSLPNPTAFAGSLLATNIAAPSTPASGTTSIYVDATQKVLSAINDAGTVSITIVPSSAAAGQFVNGISVAGVLSYGTPTGSGTVNSSPAGQIAYYPASSAAVSGNANLAISGTALTLAGNGIGASSADGFVLSNTTAAGAGAQQFSPRLHLIGQGWKTNATAGSQTVDWILENQPVQGAASPTTNLVASAQVNGAGYTAQAKLTSGGVLNLATGLQIAGVANSGNVLRGNGTNFVAAALAAADLSNGVTGSGAVVLATSPSLTTPVLGVASATSINKVAITAPASAATLTIANSKTFTVSNTLTLTGTDATSFAFPAASDTVACLATAQSFTAQNIFAPVTTIASATAAALDDVKVAATTTTITGNTGSPITKLAKVGIYQPTFTDASAVTITDATTLYIDNAPAAAGSVTITNAWALRVGAGNVKFGGHLSIEGVLSTGATGTGKFVFDGSPTLVTPTLGVASATTINKVTLTTPATGSTLTIADGKTLTASNSGTLAGGDAFTLAIAAAKTFTVSNTLTLTGTDSTSFAFPAASDTVGCLGTAQTWTAQNIHNVATTIASATAAALDDLKVSAATTTITGNTGSPITRLAKVGLYRPTITDASAVTVTDAATLYIDNSPLAAGSVTITNAWALLVGAGASKLQATTLAGALTYGGVTLSNAVTGTGNMVLSASPTLSGTIAGNLTWSGTQSITNATDSANSTSTGALVVSGGVGIALGLTVGGEIWCGSLQIQAATNVSHIWELTNGSADQKFYDVHIGGAIMQWRLINDAFNSAVNWLQVTRSGTAVSSIDFAGPMTNTASLALYSGTAIPAGGTAGSGLKFSSTSNFGVFFGSGVPSLSAAKGSIYLRSDGAVNARLYINTDGSTTWTAFNTTS